MPHWTPALALYAPVGCALAALRMALWIALLAVDQPALSNSDPLIRCAPLLPSVRNMQDSQLESWQAVHACIVQANGRCGDANRTVFVSPNPLHGKVIKRQSRCRCSLPGGARRARDMAQQRTDTAEAACIGAPHLPPVPNAAPLMPLQHRAEAGCSLRDPPRTCTCLCEAVKLSLAVAMQVSNHISVGDLMALYARPERYVHLVTARLPKRVTQVRVAGKRLNDGNVQVVRRCALLNSPKSLHAALCWPTSDLAHLCLVTLMWFQTIWDHTHVQHNMFRGQRCHLRLCGQRQARNHRVQLRHAVGEMYCRLAEPRNTDPVHLFPGAL